MARVAPSTMRCRKSHFTINEILLVAVMLLAASTAYSGTIYDNTILSGAVSGLTGSARTIQIDDVLVPSSRDPSQLPIAINSLTLGLQAMPGDTGEFSLYLYSVRSDGTPAPNPALIETKSVTFPSFFQLVTFGSGSGKLFTVEPDFTAQSGFGLFYLGLEARSISAASWAWADGPDANLPTGYLDNSAARQIFLNYSPGSPFPPNFSFYMQIDGAPIPEPSQVAYGLVILLVSGVWAISGGRREKSKGRIRTIDKPNPETW